MILKVKKRLWSISHNVLTGKFSVFANIRQYCRKFSVFAFSAILIYGKNTEFFNSKFGGIVAHNPHDNGVKSAFDPC